MRSRNSIALSLPVLLFACLVLATNARAQDSFVFQLEDAGSHSLFQACIDRQQVPVRITVSKTILQVAVRSLTINDQPAINTDRLPLAAAESRREITPGQCFGNGAQAAP